MNREEMRKYIGVTGYSLGQVEKDYFQHIILSAISRKMSASLIFKGGTALQKTGIIPRFSEDLDFTMRGKISLPAMEKTVLSALEAYNYPADIDNVSEDERSAGFRVRIQGPLYRNGRGISTIKFDISRRESVILPPQQRVMHPVYFDILPYTIEVMELEEIAAEKIRTIYVRNRPKDIYDLYKLIKNGTEIKIGLVDEKLRYYGMKFDIEAFLQKSEESSMKWEEKLVGIMEDIPPKGEVIAAITEALKASSAASSESGR